LYCPNVTFRHAAQLLQTSESESNQLRNQLSSIRRELETVHAQRNETMDEVRRLNMALAQRDADLLTLNSELTEANRDRENLRETATRYLEEVKAYEELLALKVYCIFFFS